MSRTQYLFASHPLLSLRNLQMPQNVLKVYRKKNTRHLSRFHLSDAAVHRDVPRKRCEKIQVRTFCLSTLIQKNVLDGAPCPSINMFVNIYICRSSLLSHLLRNVHAFCVVSRRNARCEKAYMRGHNTTKIYTPTIHPPGIRNIYSCSIRYKWCSLM